MKNPTPKILGKLIEKIPNILDEWKGYPEMFSFTFSIAISRLYLLLQTDILQKLSLGAPGIISRAFCPNFNTFQSRACPVICQSFSVTHHPLPYHLEHRGIHLRKRWLYKINTPMAQSIVHWLYMKVIVRNLKETFKFYIFRFCKGRAVYLYVEIRALPMMMIMLLLLVTIRECCLLKKCWPWIFMRTWNDANPCCVLWLSEWSVSFLFPW